MSVQVQIAPEKKSTDGLVGALLANRYLIERKLGEGAMGAVYQARHVKVGRPFAVKVLHRKLLEDQKIALRFEREAELAGRLHHPNVIGVVDVGETPEGMRYMVMDFAEGSDLADVLTEAPMPPARIIPLVRQMLEGLYHAHEAGLIHRDFKPENVIIERDDHGTEVPRIVDFGISILRDAGDSTDATGRLTTNGLVLGTPHYMAPEQAVADPIDHRIDLFAMGIVVYEMLSGKLPFDGAGAEVARANLLLDPPPISRRVPYLEVDPLLEAFARRLMAKNRDHRPATAKKARELLDLIERDRSAAAAALGVPLEAGTRAPQVTQPVAPQPGAPHPTHQTAPARRVSAVDISRPRPSALEAPAMRPPSAGWASPPETAMADPLPWPDGGSRRRWMIAGGVGLVSAGAIIAIAVGISGSRAAKPPEAPPLAAVAPATPPEPTAAPAPAPPAPAETVRDVAAPAVADPPSDPGPSATEPPPEEPAKPGPTPRKGRPTKAMKTGSSAAKSARPEEIRSESPRPEEIKAEPPKAEPPKAEPPKAEPPRPEPPSPPTTSSHHAVNGSVDQQWLAVRNEIDELARVRGEPAVARARARWQLIKIQEAIKSPEIQRKTLADLAEIRKMLAEVQK